MQIQLQKLFKNVNTIKLVRTILPSRSKTNANAKFKKKTSKTVQLNVRCIGSISFCWIRPEKKPDPGNDNFLKIY